jgi:hypothetical protein
MLQFYFLSVLCNALTGFVLFKNEDPEPDEPRFRLSVRNGVFRLVLGLLTCLTAILKILSAVPGDFRIIGDLVPALLGFFAGFILVFSYYRSHSDLESEKSDQFASFFEKNQRWIGIVALSSALLHFLFPTVTLL